MHALLFTDVVDSTQVVDRLGDGEATRLWTEHDRRARDLLATHDGREIDRTDGFFILFEHAVDAIHYALAYHAALGDLGLRARAGIHVGPVNLRANPQSDVARGAKPIEVEGIAKPLAARIMALARGNQTLLSASAREALGVSSVEGVDCERHGFYRLKGIETPIEIFEIGRRGVTEFVPPPDGEKAYQVVQVDEQWRPVREIPHNLLAERDSFVGRGQELRNLAARLDAGNRLLTVIGPGGAGKTRLAQHYAWGWLGDWPGGVYFCDLSEARNLDAIHYAVASALGIELGGDEPANQIGHAIVGRGRCLVILDNFEQVVGLAADSVGRWLDRECEASFLVTSRERLHLNGEVLFSLDPLRLADESIELFRARAAAQQSEFVLDDANRAIVSEIVTHLDGLPLAIELAAARISVLTPAHLLKRLEDRFRVLGGAKGRSARQSTLRHAIDWSWTLLTPTEQLALAQCAVFEGGFTLAAAEAILSPDGTGEAMPTLEIVQALVDKSLLRTFTTKDHTRFDVDERYFGMYVSIREYAREQLHGYGIDVESATERRHGVYFAAFGSDDYIEALSLSDGAVLHRGLALDLDNLVAVCRRSVPRQWPVEAVATFRAAWEVLELRGPVTLATTLGSALLSMPGLTERQRCLGLRTAAMSSHHAGRVDTARDYLDEALVLARRLSDQSLEGRLLAQLGALDLDQGLVEQARMRLLQALSLHRGAADRNAEGATLGSLGNLDFDQGSLSDARQQYEKALAISLEVGNLRVQGSLLGNLGLLHFEQGHLSEARGHYEAALKVHREIGSRRLEGIVLGNLGLLSAEQANFDAAKRLYEDALSVHRAVGNRLDEGIVLGNLGELQYKCGEWSQAHDSFRAALVIARETGYRRAEGGVLSVLGELHGAQAKFSDAREALQTGEAIFRELGDQLGLGKLLCARANVELLCGDVGGARRALLEAEALATATDAGPNSELGSRALDLRERLERFDSCQPRK